MKRLLFTMCWILVLAGGIHAQNLFEYDYDAAGNRIRRRVVIMKTGGNPMDDRMNPPAVLDEGDMRLYPNPTLGVVVFELMDGSGVARYRLSDANGKLIETENVAGSPLRLDLSGRPAGVYLLEVLLEGGRKYYKIIKQ